MEVALEVELLSSSPDASQPAETSTHALEEALRTAFQLRIPVRQVPAGHLPRFELKAKRWVEKT